MPRSKPRKPRLPRFSGKALTLTWAGVKACLDYGQEVYTENVTAYGGCGVTLVCVDYTSRCPCYIMEYADVDTLLQLGVEQGIFD